MTGPEGCLTQAEENAQNLAAVSSMVDDVKYELDGIVGIRWGYVADLLSKAANLAEDMR